MNACENGTAAITESPSPQRLESLFDDAETSAQPVQPGCGIGVDVSDCTADVVPYQPVKERKRRWFSAIWREVAKVRAAKNAPHIVHVKVDELFASVEQVLNPRLRGKPVLVGRGVVASASCEAKFHGARVGMSLPDAAHVCPKAIVVPGKYEHYADFAERVRRILETYTPAVETAALDDFYLDFAGSEQIYTDFEGTLRRMQAEVLGRTGLNVSVGAARTKVVASIASQLERPRGLRIAMPGTEEAFLAPLPVEKLHGIGHAHGVALAEQGVTTIGQLRRIPKPVLTAAFGEDMGKQIWECARGLDRRESPRASACVSREAAIEGGTLDIELLSGLLVYLSERIAATLREQGNHAGSIGVRVEYVDRSSAQRSIRLMCLTNNARELVAAARELFAKVVTRGVAVRRVRVSAANIGAEQRQNETIEPEANRRWVGNPEVRNIRGSYRWNAVLQDS
ncbi:MAG TPA: DNA polymerase IV [Candidatus Acidoferrum sp.]|jgi:DNA polymerase-4